MAPMLADRAVPAATPGPPPPARRAVVATPPGGRSHERWRSVFAAAVALVLGALAAWTGSHLAPDLEAWPGVPAGGALDEAPPSSRGTPLTIVENRGQVPGDMPFYAQGGRFAFAFYPDQVLFSFVESHEEAASGPGLAGQQGHAVALRFPGGDPDVVVEGYGPTGGQVNYLRGDDPGAWQTGLPAYTGVVYRELWPGIDLLLTDGGTELKYEFHVHPGADPDVIALSYAGADGLTVEPDGSLAISTPLGQLRDAPPVSWQVVGSERVPVESRYVLGGAGGEGEAAYGFALGDHDPRYLLVVDPGLDYSTYVGGGAADTLSDIAVDGSGNVYLTGWTLSTDFPTTPGAFDRSHNGGNLDAFVTKLNGDGTGLVYSTYLGGSTCPGENAYDRGRAIEVDASGHAYVTGVTTSPNFPTTAGAFQPTMLVHEPSSTCQAAFVTKLDPSGSGLVYSTFLGGTSQDDGRDLAVDGAGNAYVVGDTCSQNFPVTSGAFQTTRGAGCSAFLAKLNATGSGLAYATYFGGGTESSDTSIADAVAIDGSGNAYVTGVTRAQDFPSTPGALQPDHPGGDFVDLFTAYVVKVNASGSDLLYGTFLGGTKREAVVDLAVDAAGHAYVRGSTLSPEFPVTPGAYDTQFTGTSESFLSKLTSDGSDLVFSTFMKGAPGARIALDADDNIWLAGGTSATNAFTTPDAFSQVNSGMGDAWLGLMGADGSELLYGTYFGGVNNDAAGGVALDADGHVYIGGTTSSFDLPTTAGAFQSERAGDSALFVAKFGEGGGVVDPDPPPPTQTDSWSGRIERESTIRHFANVSEHGTIEIDLDWDESRADLRLRVVHAATGTVVFTDDSAAKPKQVSFENQMTGLFGYDVINPSRRRADYTLTVRAPLPTTTPPPGLTSVTLDPATVTGGQPSTGRVNLSRAARPAGEEIELSSSNPAVASVPESVVVPAGAIFATFTISTGSVAANTTATITGSFLGTERDATLTVNTEDGPVMSSVSLDPAVVQGGGTSTATATLTGPAPAGGAVLTLGSSNTDVATVPSTVTVPAGQSSATFTVSTSPQQFNQSSAISAAHGGVVRSAILSVTAAPSTDTVTIERARYGSGELEVRASSSASGATLRVYVTATDEFVGTLGSNGRGEFSWPTNPQNVTVRSSLGGSATRAVSS